MFRKLLVLAITSGLAAKLYRSYKARELRPSSSARGSTR